MEKVLYQIIKDSNIIGNMLISYKAFSDVVENVISIIKNYNMNLVNSSLSGNELAVRMFECENNTGDYSDDIKPKLHTESKKYLENFHKSFKITDEDYTSEKYGKIAITTKDLYKNLSKTKQIININLTTCKIRFIDTFKMVEVIKAREYDTCEYNFSDLSFNELEDLHDFISNNKGWITTGCSTCSVMMPIEEAKKASQNTLRKWNGMRLSDNESEIRNVSFNFGYNAGSSDLEVDLVAFLLNRDGKVTNTKNVVYFNNLLASGVYLNTDDLTAYSYGNEESIYIDFNEVEEDVDSIVVAGSLYAAEERGLSFEMLTDCFVQVTNMDNHEEICHYIPENNRYATSMILGKFERADDLWDFTAIEIPENTDINGLLEQYI